MLYWYNICNNLLSFGVNSGQLTDTVRACYYVIPCTLYCILIIHLIEEKWRTQWTSQSVLYLDRIYCNNLLSCGVNSGRPTKTARTHYTMVQYIATTSYLHAVITCCHCVRDVSPGCRLLFQHLLLSVTHQAILLLTSEVYLPFFIHCYSTINTVKVTFHPGEEP